VETPTSSGPSPAVFILTKCYLIAVHSSAPCDFYTRASTH
jgi:hypothetical protein